MPKTAQEIYEMYLAAQRDREGGGYVPTDLDEVLVSALVDLLNGREADAGGALTLDKRVVVVMIVNSVELHVLEVAGATIGAVSIQPRDAVYSDRRQLTDQGEVIQTVTFESGVLNHKLTFDVPPRGDPGSPDASSREVKEELRRACPLRLLSLRNAKPRRSLGDRGYGSL